VRVKRDSASCLLVCSFARLEILSRILLKAKSLMTESKGEGKLAMEIEACRSLIRSIISQSRTYIIVTRSKLS